MKTQNCVGNSLRKRQDSNLQVLSLTSKTPRKAKTPCV